MLDVLCFAAHPDDVELGMGGTVLRLTDAGYRVGIVDITAGERGSRGTAETRAAESENASELMSVAARETLDFPDTELEPTLALRRAIIEAVRRHRPRLVFAPLPGDLHPDHDAAGQAVRRAFYPSGMKNVDADGDPHRPARLLHYFMHDESSDPVLMDVTDVWERRLEVARCYASQLHRDATDGDDFPTQISQPDFLLRLEGRARAWGMRAGVQFAEAFQPARPMAFADPASFVGAPPCTDGASGDASSGVGA